MSVFFNGFTNYMDAGIKYTLRKVVDTKMGEILGFFQSREALQRDLDRLEGWATLNCFHFNRCRILHLEWGNPGHACKLGKSDWEQS